MEATGGMPWDGLFELIGKSGDNVTSTHFQKRDLTAQRTAMIYGELTQDEKDRRNRVYLVVGIVVLVILASVFVLFKK